MGPSATKFAAFVPVAGQDLLIPAKTPSFSFGFWADETIRNSIAALDEVEWTPWIRIISEFLGTYCKTILKKICCNYEVNDNFTLK